MTEQERKIWAEERIDQSQRENPKLWANVKRAQLLIEADRNPGIGALLSWPMYAIGMIIFAAMVPASYYLNWASLFWIGVILGALWTVYIMLACVYTYWMTRPFKHEK